MVKYKVKQTVCSLCGQDRLCDTVVFCAREKTDKKLMPFRALKNWTDEQENSLGAGYPYHVRLHVCPACAQAKGSPPKRLWITWAVSWVLMIAGMLLMQSLGSTNGLSMVLATVGAWVMLFSALFLVVKSNLGFGLSLLVGLVSITPLGIIILPLLRKDINRNEQIVTSLTPLAHELIQYQGKGSVLDQYREGLKYLDSCGDFDEIKLHRFNIITGNRLSEAEIQTYIRSADLTVGGMNTVRDELRKTISEAVGSFEKLQAQGVDLSKYHL